MQSRCWLHSLFQVNVALFPACTARDGPHYAATPLSPLVCCCLAVSGRSLSDFHLLTHSTVSTTAQPSVQSDQGASLTTIHTWEEGAALPVTSPPARAPPNAALTSPSLQLPSNNASTAASVLAAPPARTPAPPNQAPLRGVPSPGLLAQIANFPGQSDTKAADSTNSSAAVGADGTMMAVLERIPEPAGNNSCIGSSTISNSTVPCVRNISMDSTEAPLVANSSNITPAASMDSSNTSSRSLPAVQPGDPALHAPHLVPDRCIIAGSSLFSSCAAELSEAQVWHCDISWPSHAHSSQMQLSRKASGHFLCTEQFNCGTLLHARHSRHGPCGSTKQQSAWVQKVTGPATFVTGVHSVWHCLCSAAAYTAYPHRVMRLPSSKARI